MKAAVTIICPIRNEEQYIADCLDSLVNQTYDSEQLEILVMDGMSTDRTRDIVKGYEQKYGNVRLLDNPQKIVPVGLNRGIEYAGGDYILRMDGHAKAAPDYVEKSVAALESGEATGVGGPIISVNTTDTGKAIALAMSSPFGVGNSRFRTSNERCFVDSVAFTGYRRDTFEKYGTFDEEFVRCQDDEFNFRVRKLGGKILLEPAVKSWYFPRAGFKKLWRQYFGYGFWKIRVFQKHPFMMQPRHFAPATFVSILLSTLVIGIAKPFFILHFSYGFGFLWGLLRFSTRWFKTSKMTAPASTNALSSVEV
jgi:GT2 family glycosyltransferase